MNRMVSLNKKTQNSIRFSQLLREALRSLMVHKGRSFLTILGIVIGITAIVVIVSVGNGATTLITGEIETLGADILFIEPGREPEGPLDLTTELLSNSLKASDIELLRRKENVSNVSEIVPSVAVPGSIAFGGETDRPFIFGFSAEFFGEVLDIRPIEGELFGQTAIDNTERVAVIGYQIREELFGTDEALGKTVRINNEAFRITGVLPDQGQLLFFDIGNVVIVPYTAAHAYLVGFSHFNEVWVRVENPDLIPATVRDIEATLREAHGITNPDKDDFHVLTQDNLLDQVSSIVGILTNAVVAIASIALVVGGVGIMNIMLVSVTERIREIGLRKSLGATKKDILNQFLIEAIMLTGLGGIIGVVLGSIASIGIAFLIGKQLGVPWDSGITVSAAIISVSVSVTIGVVFGTFPAKRASEKDPIEAMRG